MSHTETTSRRDAEGKQGQHGRGNGSTKASLQTLTQLLYK